MKKLQAGAVNMVWARMDQELHQRYEGTQVWAIHIKAIELGFKHCTIAGEHEIYTEHELEIPAMLEEPEELESWLQAQGFEVLYLEEYL